MKFIIKNVLLISLFVGIKAINDNLELNSKNVFKKIEENHMDCSMYSNSIESFLNEYKQIYDSLTILCQLHLKSSVDNLKLTVDTMVEQKLDEYLNNVEEMRSQLSNIKSNSFLKSIDRIKPLEINLTNMINENNILNNLISKQNQTLNKILIISLIRNGEFTDGRKLISKMNEDELNSFISLVYDKNILYAEKMIELLNSLTNVAEILLGYRLLFDQMIINRQIYNTQTTSIGFRVFAEFDKKNDSNLALLRSHLPDSLRKFPWNQNIVISNVKVNEFIFIASSSWLHDHLRRIPFTHPIKTTSDTSLIMNFIPILNGKYFYIKNRITDNYLYAETNEFSLDGERRGVFVWINKNEIKESGRWQLEPLPGSMNFKIKNIYWNEYLSIGENIKVSESYYQLFTLKSGGCFTEHCLWNIKKST